MLGWLLVAAVVASCASCTDDPRTLQWRVRFADPTAATDVRAFEARILQGGCDGDVVYRTQFSRDAMPSSLPAPPTLGPGSHGFAVTARDAVCRVVAFECEGATLPLEGGGAIEVILAAVTASRMECAASLCMDGICEETDGGVTMCADGTGDCNGDPTDGCETDTTSDIAHCGACDAPCRTPHAEASCGGGTCAITACDMGWNDCDGDSINGCETSFLTLTDCGRCRMPGEDAVCDFDHSVVSCDTGSCQLDGCHEGWDDCDGAASNGCETPLDLPTTCGDCMTTCAGATPVCHFTGGVGACLAACPAATTVCMGTCIDPLTDPRHCGGCPGTACTLDHASAVCTGGTCAIDTCNPGWADCDGSAANGCETSTTTLLDCGGCGMRCDVTDAVTSCVTGTCTIDRCFGPRDDCNGDPSDGCEADLASAISCGSCTNDCDGVAIICGFDGMGGRTCVESCTAPTEHCGDRCLDVRFDSVNCGGCGVRCELPNAEEACILGTCSVVACPDGRGDCDGDPTNGCEADLALDENNCGRCGTICPAVAAASPMCAGGTCSTGCDPGFADCNGTGDDGCETPTDTLTDCGRCGNTCSLANATPACTDGSCQIASCAPGFDDCDGSDFNGCEADLDSSRDDCGRCGNRCVGRSRMCCMGTCAETCP